eukprot:m.82925 g.82925  ORF g.82925 m.82925 type:complete len:928 (-) comp25572_c0_seq1:79-2862(-)
MDSENLNSEINSNLKHTSPKTNRHSDSGKVREQLCAVQQQIRECDDLSKIDSLTSSASELQQALLDLEKITPMSQPDDTGTSSLSNPQHSDASQQEPPEPEHGGPGSLVLTTMPTHMTRYLIGMEHIEDLLSNNTPSPKPKKVDHPGVRNVVLTKGSDGFGFTLKGSQPVRILTIEKGSPADDAGLAPLDSIVSIGGNCAIFLRHEDVVQHIIKCGNTFSLAFLAANLPLPVLENVDPPVMSPRCDLFGFGPDETDYDNCDSGSYDSDNDSESKSTNDKLEDEDLNRKPVQLPPPPLSAYQPSPSHRRKWMEFINISNATKSSPMWNIPGADGVFAPGFDYLGNPRYSLTANDTVCAMLVDGVPHSMRRQVWIRSCGAAVYKAEVNFRYDEIAVCASALLRSSEVSVQIEKDLLRTFPNNAFFDNLKSEGTKRLRRILYATAWTIPEIGYCQGMGMLVAMLLLVMEEDEAFWCLRAMLLKLIPKDYYSSTLIGAMTDQRVLRDLIVNNEQHVARVLEESNIELSLISLNWFLTAFSTVAPLHTALRVWDCFMLEGSTFLFKVSLAMVTLRASFITSYDETGDIFNALSDTPSFMNDPDVLCNLSFSFMHIEQEISFLRLKHRAVLETEYAEIQRRREQIKNERKPTSEPAGSPNVAKRAFSLGMGDKLARKWTGFRSPVSQRNRKPKNIEQTERLMLLGNAVQALIVHMQQLLDEELEIQEEKMRLRSELVAHIKKSEGERASKLVQQHSTSEPSTIRIAGDNRKNPILSVLVTDGLCLSLFGLLSHALKECTYQGVWDFVSDVCLTQLATPEWLRKAPEEIIEFRETLVASNFSIEAAAVEEIPAELKFTQLVCKGLNAGVLRDWLAVLSYAANSPHYKQWYKPTAFLRSTAVMIQVNEDLKRLNAHKFNVHLLTNASIQQSIQQS